MGRANAKMKMEMIGKEKSRMVTMKRRKEGLVKKLEQLSTLCDVPACMIIYDPATNSSSIWPPNSDANVRRLIDNYKAKRKDPSGVKNYGLSDFFEEKQKNIQEEVVKLQKKKVEGKWDDRLCSMDESELREMGAAVRGKAEAVRSRIEFLKRKAESEALMMMKQFNYSNLGEFCEDVNCVGGGVMDVNANAMGTNSQFPMMMMSGESQPNPNYYYSAQPLPQPLPMPYMDHNYCFSSSMDGNNNIKWCDVDDDVAVHFPLHVPPPLPYMDHNMNLNNYCFSSMNVNQNANWCYVDAAADFLPYPYC